MKKKKKKEKQVKYLLHAEVDLSASGSESFLPPR